MYSIKFDQQQFIAILTLNRPKVFNSFDREMALSMQRHLDDCEANPKIRAILITGEGKAFSAGQDLQEVTDPERNLGFERILMEHYNPIIQRIRRIEKPVIAAVNGVAAGAAANMALACDVVIASESASFLQAFSKIGLVPDSGGTYTLPRLIGFQKASALMMLGDKISAAEAERMGMVYKVFPAETFMEEAMKIASKLSKMPTKGLGLAKRALNQAMSNSLEEQLRLETNLQVQAGATEDYTEGVNAFLEKRAPDFQGK
ncbi:MAG: enoyl-CoA hydratase-related protein [Bacteroidota bacterium]